MDALLIKITRKYTPMDWNTLTENARQKKSAFCPVRQESDPQEVRQEARVRAGQEKQEQMQSEEEGQRAEGEFMEEQEEQGFYCMTCQEKYNIRICACDHQKQPQTRFKCDIGRCGREFLNMEALNYHRQGHLEGKPYECDFGDCDQRFRQKSNLNRHKRIHKKEKPFICEKCCKSFTTTTNLKQHIQVHLEDRQKRKKYVCQIKGCNKEYLYMCGLKKHKQECKLLEKAIKQRHQPVNPTFSLTINQCQFVLTLQLPAQPPDTLLTYRASQGVITYGPELFKRVQEQLSEREEEQVGREAYVEDVEAIIASLLEGKQGQQNGPVIVMEMHEHLSSIANLIVKAVISFLGDHQNHLQSFTLVVPNYPLFKDLTRNLLTDLPFSELPHNDN